MTIRANAHKWSECEHCYESFADVGYLLKHTVGPPRTRRNAYAPASVMNCIS
jgi:hypothetical protein